MQTPSGDRIVVSRLVRWVLAVAVAGSLTACKQGPETRKPAATQASSSVGAVASQPVKAIQPASQPASRPASQPASRPASTYDSKPPYPVSLYVLDPQEEQPGWLKIVQLADDNALATCSGSFPEKNEIQVDTNNVRRLRLHIGHLPLAQRKRIVLHIDGQAMELAHKNRAFILFERSHTGQWRIVRSDD